MLEPADVKRALNLARGILMSLPYGTVNVTQDDLHVLSAALIESHNREVESKENAKDRELYDD